MMKSMIVSGNPNYGVAEAIRARYPEARFFSRSHSGHDFSKHEAMQEFVQASLKYEVYVSCSCLARFRQTLMLEMVVNEWLKQGKKGHIVAIGSTADTPVKGTPWIYPIEKKALKAYCRNLSMAALGGHGSKPSGIRISYISPGYIATPGAEKSHPGKNKLTCDSIVDAISWVINQPEGINVSEIALDPIQLESAGV
jgi:NAD(P)-dependent dehydrogenase (short-subunit alcohol dehydrogenase family)